MKAQNRENTKRVEKYLLGFAIICDENQWRHLVDN